MKDQFIQNCSEKQKSVPFDSKLSILKDHYGYSNYLDKIHNQETRNGVLWIEIVSFIAHEGSVLWNLRVGLWMERVGFMDGKRRFYGWKGSVLCQNSFGFNLGF